MASDLVAQVAVDDAEDARRRARFPGGAALTFEDLVEHARTPTLAALAATEPVTWAPAMGGWLVTGRAPAREVLGSGPRFTVLAEPNLVRASLGRMMLTTDGAEQERGRRPFEEPFRLRPVRERFEGPVRARVDALLDGLPDGDIDLGRTFASPFAIGVAADLLGLSNLDPEQVRAFYEAFAAAMVYDGDPEPQRRADEARDVLNGLLHAEIERVRERGGSSITAAVMTDPARGLDDDEVVAQLRVILFGAIETVESMLLNTVLLLLEHPAELSRVRSDPSGLPNAIEEAMRLIPPVSFIERWTAEPVELGGVRARRGRVRRRQRAGREPRPRDVPRPGALRRHPRQRPPPPRLQPRRAPLPRLQPRAAAGRDRPRGAARAGGRPAARGRGQRSAGRLRVPQAGAARGAARRALTPVHRLADQRASPACSDVCPARRARDHAATGTGRGAESSSRHGANPLRCRSKAPRPTSAPTDQAPTSWTPKRPVPVNPTTAVWPPPEPEKSATWSCGFGNRLNGSSTVRPAVSVIDHPTSHP